MFFVFSQAVICGSRKKHLKKCVQRINFNRISISLLYAYALLTEVMNNFMSLFLENFVLPTQKLNKSIPITKSKYDSLHDKGTQSLITIVYNFTDLRNGTGL